MSGQGGCRGRADVGAALPALVAGSTWWRRSHSDYRPMMESAGRLSVDGGYGPVADSERLDMMTAAAIPAAVTAVTEVTAAVVPAVPAAILAVPAAYRGGQ